MKRYKSLIALMLLALTLLSACGKEEELGAWEMPAVDARPTVQPTAMLRRRQPRDICLERGGVLLHGRPGCR